MPKQLNLIIDGHDYYIRGCINIIILEIVVAQQKRPFSQAITLYRKKMCTHVEAPFPPIHTILVPVLRHERSQLG